MNVLRTPDERFAGLVGYPFEPRYHTWDGLRMHYVDEGSGAPVLLLHGEPTWSYLYREFIPPLVEAGFRCIAPDYIGFGRSDKVVEDDWYRVERHIESVRSLVDALRLDRVVLVVHDWGGPIGLRQVADDPGRFSRIFVLNTWLHRHDYPYTEAIAAWHAAATRFEPGTGDIPCGEIVSRGPDVSPERRAELKRAYDAPFPSAAHKAGARRFPWMLPFSRPEEGNAADQERCWREMPGWGLPVHFIFGDRDAVFPPVMARHWANHVPGSTVDVVPGPHFVQEESAGRIADLMLHHLGGGKAAG